MRASPHFGGLRQADVAQRGLFEPDAGASGYGRTRPYSRAPEKLTEAAMPNVMFALTLGLALILARPSVAAEPPAAAGKLPEGA
jgi:hypothetical protein